MTSRSITGLVLAAMLALPAAAHAQSRSSGSGVWLGGLFGAELGDYDGYQLRGDVEVPILRLNPELQLAGVGTISYSGLEHDVNDLELVPAIRLNWNGTPEFGAYGDAGLGLAHLWTHGDDTNSATMRFGAGAYYAMSTYARLFGELAFHPHFGDYDSFTTTLMIGVKFRL